VASGQPPSRRPGAAGLPRDSQADRAAGDGKPPAGLPSVAAPATFPWLLQEPSPDRGAPPAAKPLGRPRIQSTATQLTSVRNMSASRDAVDLAISHWRGGHRTRVQQPPRPAPSSAWWPFRPNRRPRLTTVSTPEHARLLRGNRRRTAGRDLLGQHAVALNDGIGDRLEQRLERVQNLLGFARRHGLTATADAARSAPVDPAVERLFAPARLLLP
jgi:hypothetical protein